MLLFNKMRLLGRHLLQPLKDKDVKARLQLESWESEVEDEQWQTPLDLKRKYQKASIICGKNVIFNICGNRYRLWVKVEYKNGIVLIKDVGTHKEYEKWNID